MKGMNIKMKEYEIPIMEIVTFTMENVITESPGNLVIDPDDPIITDPDWT